MYTTIKDHCKILNLLKSKLNEDLELKYKGKRIIFFPKSIDDYNTLKNEITASIAEFHTYTPVENKKPKKVLKGLPPNISSDEILQRLFRKMYLC